ncbi:MAG: hypothetical protein Q4B09_08050 [Lachnospiraceae bacterium]|nr:hypothetical protein [Lachnospiraceae bacterium]
MWRNIRKNKMKRLRRTRIGSLLLAMMLMLSALTPAAGIPVYADWEAESVSEWAETMEAEPEYEEPTYEAEYDETEYEAEAEYGDYDEQEEEAEESYEEDQAPEMTAETEDEEQKTEEENPPYETEEADEEAPVTLQPDSVLMENADTESEVELFEEADLMALSLKTSDQYETLGNGTKVYNFEKDITDVVVKINGTVIDLNEEASYDELIGENVSFDVTLYYTLDGHTLGEDADGTVVDTIIYRADNALKLKNDETGYVWDPNGGSAIVGEYSIRDGLVKITFYEDFVNNNATGNEIRNGYVTWGASVVRSDAEEEGTREVAFTGTHKISFHFYQMSKSGQLSEDGSRAEWTVRINQNNAQLEGYALSDRLYYYLRGNQNRTEVEGEYQNIRLKNLATGEETEIELPYTFGNTTDAYELTYSTVINPNLALEKIENEVELTKNGQTFTETAEVSPMEAGRISKKSQTPITYSEDGNTAYVTWVLTLYTGARGLDTAGVPIHDTLGEKLRYTKELLTEAKASLDAALAEAGLSDITYRFYTIVNGQELTPEQLSEDAEYTDFHIEFDQNLPGGKTIIFKYRSQLDISNTVASSIYGYNRIYVDGDEGTRVGVNVPNNKGNYSFTKRDQVAGTKSWATNHEYYDDDMLAAEGEADGLIPQGTRRLIWTLEANLPENYQNEQGEVVIRDQLPKTLVPEYVVIGFRHKYSDGYYYTKVSGEETSLYVHGDEELQLNREQTTVSVRRDDNNSIYITIPKELAAAGYGGEGQKFSVEIYVPIEEPTGKDTDGTVIGKYLNQAWINLVTVNSLYATQQTNVKVSYKIDNYPIQKFVNGNTGNDNNLHYAIYINPEAKDLSEGSDQLVVEDVLSFTAEEDVLVGLDLLEMQKKILTISKLMPDGEVVRLTEKDVNFTYHMKEEGDTGYRTMSIVLDDETTYLIEYDYHGFGEANAAAGIPGSDSGGFVAGLYDGN